MATMEAHDWWADVQQHRDDLAPARRPVAVWTDDDLELVPARVLERPYVADELAGRRRRRIAEARERSAEDRFRFVRTEHEPAAREPESTSRTITLTRDPEVPAASSPAPRTPAAARRRRTAPSRRERFERRPDTIAMWAAILGFLLIILAFASNDASAATAALGR